MRVVVTGGAGYIGSIVTEHLIANGDAVLVVDDLTKGHRDAVVDEAAFLHLDIGEVARLSAAMRDFGAEAVVHLAADSLVGVSMTDPALYYRRNMVAGLALLDAMREARVDKIVFSSTAAVYGDPPQQPITESTPTEPTNPYGATKLAFEHALRWYAGAYGVSSISLRYFNAAGASERNGERHEPETHLIPLVLQVALGQRADVLVFGDDYDTPDGTCVRDYIHVHDLADAHVRALPALSESGICRAYNLGCGGGYSVLQVIDVARRVTGHAIPVRMAPRRAGDPATLVASSARMQAELGWTPARQHLDEIIASAWRWMEARSRAHR